MIKRGFHLTEKSSHQRWVNKIKTDETPMIALQNTKEND
jgi:hypothetical protein